jgi:NAD dependent epimerase/dehydratase
MTKSLLEKDHMELKNSTVLVTGADGFIGSHLVEALMAEGCKVRAFVYYNSFNSWGWLDSFPVEERQKIEVVAGDVRDPNGVRQAVHGCQAVFHLAALIAIPFSYHSPDSYVDTNIKGTLNVLQAARDAGVERIFVTSTSEVYGTALYVPIDEKHPFQAQSPYSATKIGADRIAEAFHKSFDLPVTIVRPFNTYGPRQSARAVIPTLVTQLLSGRAEVEIGNTAPTRDFVFVADTVNGFVQIARSSATTGQEINIATGKEISIGDLANKLVERINPKAKILHDANRLRPPASEVDRLCGGNEKISRLTAWKPLVDIDTGLDRTIAWFRKKENLARYKHWLYNL